MPDSLALLYPEAVRPKDWLEAVCLGPVGRAVGRFSRSVAYCRAAWAAETGYDGLAGGGGSGRDAVAVFGVEPVADEAVFVRRGGGTGGAGLECVGTAGAWEAGVPVRKLSLVDDSVWLRETGDGSRSINDSVLTVDDRRGGTGGAGFRELGGFPLPTVASLTSATPAVARSEDGLDGFLGGTRGFGGLVVSATDGFSSSPRRSIKSPLSMLFTESAGAGDSRGRRGGSAGLVDNESE